ncbi:hypothetical protein AOLI_G00277480 [Acnodon oligacanthus]
MGGISKNDRCADFRDHVVQDFDYALSTPPRSHGVVGGTETRGEQSTKQILRFSDSGTDFQQRIGQRFANGNK